MEPGQVTYGGTTLDLTKTGTFTWTAQLDGQQLSLTIGPTMAWCARYADTTATDTTPQQALDRLAAAIRKAQRNAAARERLTPGQLFAREIRARLHIGPRTRRWRKDNGANGDDPHTAVLTVIVEAATGQWDYPKAFTDAIRPAYAAALSHYKHIDGYRVDTRVIRYVQELSPWEFCGLLGEMVDADVIHVGAGERWYAELAASLRYDTTGDRAIRESARASA